MKKYIILLISAGIIAGFLQSCSRKPDYQIVRQQVLDQHDRLMITGEKAMNIRALLDTLDLKTIKHAHPELDTSAERKHIRLLGRSLDSADNRMSDWMHEFKADFKGNTGQDALSYFTAEKEKVNRLDTLYQQGINAAGTYLERFNMRYETAHNGAMKM